MFSIILCFVAIFLFSKLVNKGISKIELSPTIRPLFKGAVSCTYFLVALLIICFTANVIWGNIVSWLDSLRTPEGILSLIGGDPIFADILSYGSPSELGIPTSHLQPDAIMMLENVNNCYHNSLLYLILGIIGLGLYIWSIYKRNKGANLIIIALSVLVFLSSREAAAGIVHIADFCFSGVYTPYTGDISGSFVVGFVSVAMGIYICICASTAIKETNKFLKNDNLVDGQVISTSPPPPFSSPSIPSTYPQDSLEATKECPYCGEIILAVAKKCKHCHEFLPEEPVVKTIQCPICGEDIPDNVEICPICKEAIK